MWGYLHRFLLWAPAGLAVLYLTAWGAMGSAAQGGDAHSKLWLRENSNMLAALGSSELIWIWTACAAGAWLILLIWSGKMTKVVDDNAGRAPADPPKPQSRPSISIKRGNATFRHNLVIGYDLEMNDGDHNAYNNTFIEPPKRK